MGRANHGSSGDDSLAQLFLERAESYTAHADGSASSAELHGLIARTYREEGGDASFLGLPVSDEQASGDGRVSFFQHGRID